MILPQRQNRQVPVVVSEKIKQLYVGESGGGSKKNLLNLNRSVKILRFVVDLSQIIQDKGDEMEAMCRRFLLMP